MIEPVDIHACVTAQIVNAVVDNRLFAEAPDDLVEGGYEAEDNRVG